MSIIGHSLSYLCTNLCVSFSEFVLNAKDVFPYNCEKKIDFIKKGIGKAFFLHPDFFHHFVFSESPD